MYAGWRESSKERLNVNVEAQILSKIVRGFDRDLDDARHFLA